MVLLGMDILSALVSRLQERFRTQVGTGEAPILKYKQPTIRTFTETCLTWLIPFNSLVSQFCRASWTGWGMQRTKSATRTRPSSWRSWTRLPTHRWSAISSVLFCCQWFLFTFTLNSCTVHSSTCGSGWWGASNTRTTGPERVSASVSFQP